LIILRRFSQLNSKTSKIPFFFLGQKQPSRLAADPPLPLATGVACRGPVPSPRYAACRSLRPPLLAGLTARALLAAASRHRP